jgi:hypothetical protein
VHLAHVGIQYQITPENPTFRDDFPGLDSILPGDLLCRARYTRHPQRWLNETSFLLLALLVLSSIEVAVNARVILARSLNYRKKLLQRKTREGMQSRKI